MLEVWAAVSPLMEQPFSWCLFFATLFWFAFMMYEGMGQMTYNMKSRWKLCDVAKVFGIYSINFPKAFRRTHQ